MDKILSAVYESAVSHHEALQMSDHCLRLHQAHDGRGWDAFKTESLLSDHDATNQASIRNAKLYYCPLLTKKLFDCILYSYLVTKKRQQELH